MGTRDNRPTRNFYTCIKVPSKSVCREGDSGIPNDEGDCGLDAYGIKAGRVVGSRLPVGYAASMLIESGADVTTLRRSDGETPLHLALRMGEVEVARMLIERGADVTAQNDKGETPLHRASTPPSWSRLQISPKWAEIAHMLLEHGADVNARNKNGLTPFVLASQLGLAEITDVLVQHGADSGDQQCE
jgi:ankyrin repeat protein